MHKFWLIFVLVLLVSCSARRSSDVPPDKNEVLQKINGRYAALERSVNFDIGRTGTECFFAGAGEPFDIGYRPETDLKTIVAVKAGLVTVKPTEKNHWDVSLTEKGKSILSADGSNPIHHRVGNGCDEYQVSFPIARAHAYDVAGPKQERDTYEYTYLWKWEVTQLGQALREDGEVYSQLTPAQRKELQELTNVTHGLNDGPALQSPVPSDANNPPRPGTAIFEKEKDRWVFNVRQ
ncbi:MAG TPA: hypothetical protein VLA83_14335 [Candidatus Binatia bacterium]|nr:hypothetical protein [Candidatus Binatia bacterium]